jgi:hypothetical protein
MDNCSRTDHFMGYGDDHVHHDGRPPPYFDSDCRHCDFGADHQRQKIIHSICGAAVACAADARTTPRRMDIR